MVKIFRGKTKYRQVVNKNKSSTKKKTKPPSRRKTYSLHQHKNKQHPPPKYGNHYNNNKSTPNQELLESRKDQRATTAIAAVNESDMDSESEETAINQMQELRDTFSLNTRNSNAIDSCSDEDDEDLEEDMDHHQNIEGTDDTTDEDIESRNPTIILNSLGNGDDDDDNCHDSYPNVIDDHNIVENMSDPFIKHLCYELHDNLLSCIQQQQNVHSSSLSNNNTTITQNWSKLGKILISLPQYSSKIETTTTSNKFSIDGTKIFAPVGEIPNKINLKSVRPVTDLFIKSQIIDNLTKANTSLLSSADKNVMFTQLQGELFSIVNNYQDLYYSERTFDNANEIRYVYCLHTVNHILKTRGKVLHHNAKMSKKTGDDVPEEFRDQGLVRPKVLIVVPFKDSAYKIITMIINLLFREEKGNVIKKKRFIEEYTGQELTMPKRNPKPEDYEQTFTGNTGDDFKVGLTVTKKSLKLYADFYSSDIIVASPLGLRTIIGAEGEPDRDYDFLASIELLIFDQMELFLMQNWDHLNHILNHLHLQPKDAHGTDFSRVRTWSLNGWSKYYRQTLIFSSCMLPEINAIFNRKCFNYAGKIKTINGIDSGSINQVFVQLPHVFHKFEAASVTEAIDGRFDFFVNKILPQQKDTLMKQTLVFISNYFDYVRLRNYFKREDIGFVQICEYSKEGKVARARDIFYHGDVHFLLYTERYHFFNRIRIKGIRHIVFYQLTNFSHFYYELCNLMQDGNMNKKIGNASNMTVSILYSKYDIHQLAGVVGTERALKMLKSDKNVHMMITGAD